MKTRNLAIAFATLVGYPDRIGGLGFDAAQQLLRVWEALAEVTLREYGGRRIKLIGATVLVAFPSPTRAVLCAAALRARARAWSAQPGAQLLEVRVGLQLGEVRLDRGDVFGEAVNAAARIEALAEADEILIGEALWLSMDRAAVEAREVGPRDLRGLPEPVRIFRIDSANDPQALAAPLPELAAHSPRDEIVRHLAEVGRLAVRQAEESLAPLVRALPVLSARARIFVSAGVAAVVVMAAAFFFLTLGSGR